MDTKFSYTQELRHIWRILAARWAESDWIIPRWQRPLYRLKALLCHLFLGLLSVPPHVNYKNVTDHSVAVVYLVGGVQGGTVHGPTVYWGEELRVGLGLRNWWCCYNMVSSA